MPHPSNLTVFAALILMTCGPLTATLADGNKEDMATGTVLITGSNRGIGLEFVRQFARTHWRVIASCRSPEKADALQALSREYPKLTVEALDLTDAAKLAELDRRYSDTPIDVLINNAAYLGDMAAQRFGQLDYGVFADALAVNVIGTLRVSETFMDQVQRSRQRKIIVIGSAAGSNGLLGPGEALYAYRASKAALHFAANEMAMDLAGRGITVGLINPGLVDTKGVLDLKPGDPVPEVFKPLMPLIESGQLPLIRPAESVAGMIELIGNLNAEQAGKFLNYDGTELPW